jgi:hypothetical protein
MNNSSAASPKKSKKVKKWHHDIQFIEGEFVEDVVQKFQDTKDEALITQIIENYGIYRSKWGRDFAPYLGGDTECGEQLHDIIVCRAANSYDPKRSLKPKGKSFNAYLVSAQMNQLKNFRNARMSNKNHPRIPCPVCGLEVFQVDEAHLRHLIDLKHYQKTFPTYPIVSCNGSTQCPVSGNTIPQASLSYMQRRVGYYSVEDFWNEFPNLRPIRPYKCPVTGSEISTA